MEERYYWLVRSWRDSLFMRIPDALYDSWDENDLTQPSRWLRWENEWLGLWYHPKFQAPFFECLVEGDDEESGWFFPDSAEIQKECAKIRKSIEKLGGKFVEPDIARHMVATVDRDPYIRTDIVEYPLVQLLLWPESIPSPIEPDSRSIIIKVWWKVFDREKKHAILEPEANCIVERLEEESNLRFHVKSWIANCSSSGKLFINAEIQPLSKMGYKTTTDFYNDIESTVEEFILHLESIISTYCGFRRCSRHFWEKELLISFA
ncbi:hypothetical protein [Methanoculleus sp.]|uniref:hypothetical protein n=1 Tax=Methanoculleus sp. TaxID=90427 RepID=UPI001BD55084|nr:hypothetical protein [Methanoculleus sp.]